MCKSKSSLVVSHPRSRSTSTTPTPTTSTSLPLRNTNNSHSSASSSTTNSSAASLASLRSSLPRKPLLYSFSDLSLATHHFLSHRLPSSSSSFRCSLHNQDVVVTSRPFRSPSAPSSLPSRLSSLSKSHHSSLVPLLGASSSPDNSLLYLVHHFSPGSPLSLLLRNPNNPNFTPLSSWLSRSQIADDLAQGLNYIHHHSSAASGVHNRLKSSSVLVSDHPFRAKLLHFGSADLAGEVSTHDPQENPPALRRSGSRKMRIEGSKGYMAPELLSGGRISRMSDVYAFGVLILELLSGEEPLKARVDRDGEFKRVSVIDTARQAIGGGGDSKVEREGRVRRWVDRRMRDSFPVEEAERLMRVALRCVEDEPAGRPDMTLVAGVVSKVFLNSKEWAETVRLPTAISVSFNPR